MDNNLKIKARYAGWSYTTQEIDRISAEADEWIPEDYRDYWRQFLGGVEDRVKVTIRSHELDKASKRQMSRLDMKARREIIKKADYYVRTEGYPARIAFEQACKDLEDQ